MLNNTMTVFNHRTHEWMYCIWRRACEFLHHKMDCSL